MVGKYTLKGKMVPVPGAPATPISGRESCQSLFSGSVLASHIFGDPAEGMPGFQYEGLSFISYNPKKNCYDEISLNNLGETGTMECRWAGERHLVITSAMSRNGEPGVQRGTMILSETGAIEKTSMDRLHMTGNVEQAFFAEFKKVKGTSPN